MAAKYGKMFISSPEENHVKFICQASNFSFSFYFPLLNSLVFLFFGNLTEHKHVKKSAKGGARGGEGGAEMYNSVININLFLCKLKND